jgi:hypothetical protein
MHINNTIYTIYTILATAGKAVVHKFPQAHNYYILSTRLEFVTPSNECKREMPNYRKLFIRNLAYFI